MRYTACVVAIFMASANAAASEGASLVDLIAQAEGASGLLEAERVEQEVARHHSSSARAGLLPTLSLSGSVSRGDRDTSIVLPFGTGGSDAKLKTADRDDYRAAVQLDAPILDLRTWRRIDEATPREEGAAARKERLRLSIERDVASKWSAVVAAKLALKVAGEGVKLATEALAATARRRESGRSTEADERRQAAQLAEMSANLLLAQSEESRALAALRAVLGADRDVSVALPPASYLASVGSETMVALEAGVLARDPELAEARARLDEAKASRRVRDAEGLPSLAAFASYQLARAESVNAGPKAQVGLSLGWTFSVAQSFSAEAAASSVTAQSARLDAAKTASLARLRDAKHALDAATLRLKASEARLESLDQDLMLRERQLVSGTATTLDLAEAAKKVSDAEIAKATATVDVIARRIDLIHASGRRLLEFVTAANGNEEGAR